MFSDEYLGLFCENVFEKQINESTLTNQTLLLTHRCPFVPLCAATHGPTGAFDVCSNLADYPAKSSV